MVRYRHDGSSDHGCHPGAPEWHATGDEGARTLDLRIANAALSQLSYVPINRIRA